MASSVSSESAFSAAGITISKRCNRLGGDIVKALQCLKSFINQDLFFCDVVSAAQEEVNLDLADQEPANHEAKSADVVHDGKVGLGMIWLRVLRMRRKHQWKHVHQ
jgi:hypothetical protein